MYYDKGMKRTLFTSCMCLLSVWAVGAQSTCETRVDAHPHASTRQRVNYCLNQPAPAQANNPGLVFSGVTPRHPQGNPALQEPSAREGNFDQDKIFIQRTLVGTNRFPAFKNNTLSEQEIWGKRRAVYQGQQAGREAAEQAECKPQEEPIVKNDVQETQTGLKVRMKKPSRRFMETPEVVQAETVSYRAETATQEVAPVADEYTYDAAAVQPYAPASPDAQEYVPAVQDAQNYVPAQQTAQPYAPAAQTDIPVGTSSYAPAN